LDCCAEKTIGKNTVPKGLTRSAPFLIKCAGEGTAAKGLSISRKRKSHTASNRDTSKEYSRSKFRVGERRGAQEENASVLRPAGEKSPPTESVSLRRRRTTKGRISSSGVAQGSGFHGLRWRLDPVFEKGQGEQSWPGVSALEEGRNSAGGDKKGN